MLDDLNATTLYHFTFVGPVRVMLMDKSILIAAVTATVSTPGGQPNTRQLRCRMLFPVNGGPSKATMDIITTPRNIAGAVEVKTP